MDLVYLLKVVLALALVGFVVYLIVTYIPMSDIIKQVIQVAVAVLVILWLIGLLTGQGALLPLR